MRDWKTNWKPELEKHRSIEEMAIITVLLLGICVLAIVVIHTVAQRDEPKDEKAAIQAVKWEAKARAVQALKGE